MLLNNLQNEYNILITKLHQINNELEEKISEITQQNLTKYEMTNEINKLIKEKDEHEIDIEYEEPIKVIKAKLIKAKPKQTRKFTDDELINIFNSRKPITKKLGRSMSKNDLGFLHSKCLNRKIAQWTGFQKEVLREGYNDCIKALK